MKREEKIKFIAHLVVEKKHHKETYYSKDRIVKNTDENSKSKILRQFECKKCKKLVTITDEEDKRAKFCSPRCEKLYWKHAKK